MPGPPRLATNPPASVPAVARPSAEAAPQPCAAGGLQVFRQHLRDLVQASHSFQPDFVQELGNEDFERLIGLSREGLCTAWWGVEALLVHCDIAVGGVAATCAVFDGLRAARRGVALMLCETREATTLTADGIRQLEEFDTTVRNLVKTAQQELGAAVSLCNAAECLRSSGLEGVEGLVTILESLAKKAHDITQGLEESAAIHFAAGLRRLETEVRPLLESLNPAHSHSKDWGKVSGEVLWETRMVDLADTVAHVLQDARAEAGAWAVCEDAAAALRSEVGTAGFGAAAVAAANAAAALQAAAATLREQGSRRGGALALRRARDFLANGGAASGNGRIPSSLDFPQLANDGFRWLREFAGAAAVLHDAAEHRIKHSMDDNNGATRQVRAALLEAARSLEAHGSATPVADAARKVQMAANPGGACGAAFHEAVVAASAAKGQTGDDLRAMLKDIDRDVSQALGVSWLSGAQALSAELQTSQGPLLATQTTPAPVPETMAAPSRSLTGRCCRRRVVEQTSSTRSV